MAKNQNNKDAKEMIDLGPYIAQLWHPSKNTEKNSNAVPEGHSSHCSLCRKRAESEDPRHVRLKSSLEKLSHKELQNILSYPDEMCLDEYNFDEVKKEY